jgi:hypothetical protein
MCKLCARNIVLRMCPEYTREAEGEGLGALASRDCSGRPPAGIALSHRIALLRSLQVPFKEDLAEGEGFEPPCLASLFRRGSFPLPDIVLPPKQETRGKILFPLTLLDMGFLLREAEGEGFEPPCPCGRRISNPLCIILHGGFLSGQIL